MIGDFSTILVAKTGRWPIFQGQKPYMNNLRQSAHGICFIKILIVVMYTKEQILMISGPEKMGQTNKWALLYKVQIINLQLPSPRACDLYNILIA